LRATVSGVISGSSFPVLDAERSELIQWKLTMILYIFTENSPLAY